MIATASAVSPTGRGRRTAAAMAATRQAVRALAWAAHDAGRRPVQKEMAAALSLTRSTVSSVAAALARAGDYPPDPPGRRKPGRKPGLPPVADPTPRQIRDRAARERATWPAWRLARRPDAIRFRPHPLGVLEGRVRP